MKKKSYYVSAISIHKNLIKLFEEKDYEHQRKPIELIAEQIIEIKNFKVKIGKKKDTLRFRNLHKNVNFFAGKIGFLKKSVDIKDDGNDFISQENDTYPNIEFIISLPDQYMYISTNCKNKIGININSINSALEQVFTTCLENKYSVTVKLIPEKGRFWKIVNRAKNINHIEFCLITPNIAGKTSQEIRDELNKYKKEQNATSVTEKIENKDGRLIVQETPEISARLETIENTGGKWAIKADKKIYRSTDRYAKETQEKITELVGYNIFETLK